MLPSSSSDSPSNPGGGEWSTHIQINIYGQTLDNLIRQGVNLSEILSNVGCEKHWITEVPSLTRRVDESINAAAPPPFLPQRFMSVARHPQTGPPPVQPFKSISTAEVHPGQPLNPAMFQHRPEILKECRKRSAAMRLGETGAEMNGSGASFKRPFTNQPVEHPTISADGRRTSADEPSSSTSSMDVSAPDFFDDNVKKILDELKSQPMKEEPNGDNGEQTVGPTAGNLIPKMELIDPEEGELSETMESALSSNFMSDSTSNLIDLLRKISEGEEAGDNEDSSVGLGVDDSMEGEDEKGKVKTNSSQNPESSADSANAVHVIRCRYPECTRTCTWKVKYGKLRLVDHALTHIGTKILPCRMCGISVQNVRQMRCHYSKKHSGDRPLGYGMKDMPIDEKEMKELWKICYGDVIGLIGEATSRQNPPSERVMNERLQRRNRKTAEGESSMVADISGVKQEIAE